GHRDYIAREQTPAELPAGTTRPPGQDRAVPPDLRDTARPDCIALQRGLARPPGETTGPPRHSPAARRIPGRTESPGGIGRARHPAAPGAAMHARQWHSPHSCRPVSPPQTPPTPARQTARGAAPCLLAREEVASAQIRSSSL